MASTSIMIDGAQLLSKTATGIGSYTRTLAGALKAAGCDVSILYGQRAQQRSGELPLSLAAQVFGNEPRSAPSTHLLRRARIAAAVTLGQGRRARALPVFLDGVDLSSFEPSLPSCEQVLNADELYDRAHVLFASRRRFVKLQVPRTCRAAHWTAPLAIEARGIPNIYTLHDLIPLQFPHFVIDHGARGAALHAAIAREADHIITVSEASKRHIVDLLKVPEERVSVTYQPAPELPALPRLDAERLVESVYGVEPGAYALHLGAIEPKKNLKRLVEAFLLADTTIPLLTVGPLGWLYEDDVALMDTVAQHAQAASAHRGRPRAAGRAPVRRLGYLPRRHVVALLQCARFLVFPSIYEGFGLPVLEAMQLGVPVVTSNTSSLPEVAGEAALLVPPLDVSAIAEQIRRLANDDHLCADLARRGPLQAARFSPANYRRQLAAAYRKVGLEIDATEVTRTPVASPSERLIRHPGPVEYPPAA